MFEGPVQDLIDELGKLPGIGPKSAQRIAFHLLSVEPPDIDRLTAVLGRVRGEVRFRTLLGGGAGRSRGLVHGIAYLAPGKIEGAHHHPATGETIHVLAGSGAARLDEATYPLAAGDTVFVPAGTIHEWSAGAEGTGTG